MMIRLVSTKVIFDGVGNVCQFTPYLVRDDEEKVNMLEQNRRLDMLWTHDVPFVSLWVTLNNNNIFKAQVIEPDI